MVDLPDRAIYHRVASHRSTSARCVRTFLNEWEKSERRVLSGRDLWFVNVVFATRVMEDRTKRREAVGHSHAGERSFNPYLIDRSSGMSLGSFAGGSDLTNAKMSVSSWSDRIFSVYAGIWPLGRRT